MPNSRIFVLVHDLVGRPVKARVEYRVGKQRKFRVLDFDNCLQRHMGHLDSGRCQLRIKGPKGTSEEQRNLILDHGDNHVSVMVAEPGLPAMRTPNGNWYFKTRADERLLHVTGLGARQKTSDILRKKKYKFEPIAISTKIRDDDVLFRISVSGSKEKEIQMLEGIASDTLAERGLAARVSLPGYVGDEVSFGLTDEIIIRFQGYATTAQIAQLAKHHSLQQLRPIAWLGNAFLFRHPKGASIDLLDLIDDLNKDSLVAFAELNLAHRFEKTAYTPSDYLYPETPHLVLVNADDAWDTIHTSTDVNRGGSPDVVISVLDPDGVDPTHPELTGDLSDGTAKQIANFDFVNMVDQTLDNCPGDHGTQCAGSATGRSDNIVGASGVAPNCKLIGGRFSSTATILELADILVWMAGFPTSSTLEGFPAQLTQGAHILSNSWGSPFMMLPLQTLRDLFDFLTTYPRDGRGAIPVFSTGNYGYELVDSWNPISADPKTLAIGASINTHPTNPVNSNQPDHESNMENLPAVVDTRTYFSPYGLTVDLVSPSHTCYDSDSPDGRIVDPIMAPVRTGQGDWPANAVSATTLTSPVEAGATSLPAASTAGFSIGDSVLLDIPGAEDAETTTISDIGEGQLMVTAIVCPHAAGTNVTTGPNNYAMNGFVGFGGTSHSCPTAAGAAALLLSVKPDLNWVEVRQILRTTAVQIDAGQTFATGQWIDLDGDGVNEFSQWYGYGRLDVDAAVSAAIDLTLRSDAVVRDNLEDAGTVPSTGWHAASPDIWVRKTDDPIPELTYEEAPPHENPQFGQDNYVYLRVLNRGTAMAPEIFLRALVTHFPGIEFQYPDDWQPTPRLGDTPELPLQPGAYLVGETVVNNLAAGESTIVKMVWNQDLVPPQTVTMDGLDITWHPCLLAEAAPHDGPAIISGLSYPVKGDNNIAHRNIAIDYTAMGGSSPMMHAVIAGTRDPSGVDSLVIDRTALPAGISVVLRMPDISVMKHWIEIVRAGNLLPQAQPLGDLLHEAAPLPDQLDAAFKVRECCDIILLSDARLAVQCCDDDLLLIDAPKGTRVNKLCRSAGKFCRPGAVHVDSWKKRDVLCIDHGAGAIALPLRLMANVWAPVFVGTKIADDTRKARGRILMSQARGDGQMSPGYEIEV